MHAISWSTPTRRSRPAWPCAMPRRSEPLNVRWFEEPTQPEDVEGCAELARRTRIPDRRLRDRDGQVPVRPADRRRRDPGRAVRRRAGRRLHRGSQDRGLRPDAASRRSPPRTTRPRFRPPPRCSCCMRYRTATTSSATRTPTHCATSLRSIRSSRWRMDLPYQTIALDSALKSTRPYSRAIASASDAGRSEVGACRDILLHGSCCPFG